MDTEEMVANRATLADALDRIGQPPPDGHMVKVLMDAWRALVSAIGEGYNIWTEDAPTMAYSLKWAISRCPIVASYLWVVTPEDTDRARRWVAANHPGAPLHVYPLPGLPRGTWKVLPWPHQEAPTL